MSKTNTINFFKLLLLFSCSCLHAATIDFDANYNGTLTGSALISEINAAVNAANTGDVIVFKSSNYEFEDKTITITKEIMLKGKYIGGLLPDVRGTHNIQTTFSNIRAINIKNNSVRIRDLKIIASSNSRQLVRLQHDIYNRHSPDAKQYVGIEFINNEFVGGGNHINGFNGAGMLVKNCEFINYKSYAYTTDRRDRIDKAPKIIFEKNIFKADLSATNFNLRAISFDAGNDEYPSVWDHSGTIIRNNFFDGTGIAYSKCSNSIVEGNTFYNYSMVTDLIHFEEYTSDIEVRNNIFEFKRPSRGFFIDREGQPTSNITITGNTFIGKYGWIISAYSPRNFVFTNNDFTDASANNNNFKTFDFGFTQRGLAVPGHDPLTNLVFENNKGLFQNTQGNFRYYERDNSSSSSNKIEFNNSKTERIGVTVADEVKAVFDNKIIKLKSKTAGDYLYADGESVKIGPERTDATDEWEISYRPPFQYVLRNVNTGRYLEVEDAYTLNHIKNPGLKPRILVENKWSYPKGAKTPDWYLEFHSTSVGGVNFYELQPGGE